jgi:hypothetical protein
LSSRDIVFEGQVWRVFPVPGKARLVVECRYSTDRKVSFSSIDLKTAKVSGVFQDPEEPWWLSVSQVMADYLLLHGFRDAQHPEPLGIWVLKTEDARLLWKNKSWTLASPAEGEVIWLKEDGAGAEPFSADLKKGVKANGIESSGQNLPSSNVLATSSHYSEGTEAFEEVQSFLKDLYGWNPVSGLDYQEYADRVVISFYLYEKETYTNRLLVLDAEGNTLLLETLSEGNKGIGSGTFLIHENKLVFVRQLSTLVLYDLS